MFKKIIISIFLFGAIVANDKQKVILITGTAHGIGKATAEYLIDKGHIVYGGDILVQENLYLNDIGGVALEMDVTKQKDVDNAINQVIAEQGRIDVLVNNAGIAVGSAIEDVSMEDMDMVTDMIVETDNAEFAATMFENVAETADQDIMSEVFIEVAYESPEILIAMAETNETLYEDISQENFSDEDFSVEDLVQNIYDDMGYAPEEMDDFFDDDFLPRPLDFEEELLLLPGV